MSPDNTPDTASTSASGANPGLQAAAQRVALALTAMQEAEDAVTLAVRGMSDRAHAPDSDDSQP
jgi:hypothetical protein